MIHFSEVLALPVTDSELKRLGRVDDLVVDSSEAAVQRLVLRRGNERLAVPWSQVASLSPDHGRAELADGAEPTLVEAGGSEGEMLALKRDVLDKQIIDTQGRKVVRVNDIALEEQDGRLYLRRVDVGLAGAIRRLLAGLVRPRVVRRLAAGFPHRDIRWDYVGLVDPRSATIRLKVHQQLARLHPADLADIIEDLGRVERSAIVSSLDPETAAQALSETEPEVQAAVVEQITPDRAADLLEEMPPDEAADILGDLSEERSQAVLDAMEEEDADDVRELLSFEENSAGGLMTTEFFRAGESWSAGDVLEAIRGLDDPAVSELDEVPVVTEQGKLVGVAPLAALVRTPADAPVTAACRAETPSVGPSATLAEVVSWFEKYHLRTLAVVDEHEALMGIINVEDVFTRLSRRR
ncbi:MAG TPA: CBS domain-containing protein [Vicinamibacteria bacterium]|nr:CBS domain-containing protein [Vicinamibacteria bacterium]